MCAKMLLHKTLVKLVGMTLLMSGSQTVIVQDCKSLNLLTAALQQDLVPTCRELGIAFLAYSPLGRGMLTGAFKMDELSPTDFRRVASPRFTKEAMEQVCPAAA